jgi:hypothetical protein
MLRVQLMEDLSRSPSSLWPDDWSNQTLFPLDQYGKDMAVVGSTNPSTPLEDSVSTGNIGARCSVLLQSLYHTTMVQGTMLTVRPSTSYSKVVVTLNLIHPKHNTMTTSSLHLAKTSISKRG